MKISALILFVGIFSVSAKSYSQEAKVSLEVENVTVNEVFEIIRSQTAYSFWFDLKNVDISRKVSVNAKEKSVKEVLSTILKGQNLDIRINGNHIVIVPRNTLPKEGALQNKKTITGTVLDKLGEPIIGANVVEKGTANGVVTDLDGKFSITVAGNAVLQVSYIGYIGLDVPVRNQTSLRIVLKEDLQALDEVVVVGYGTMKKRDLTGAVSSVKMEDTPLTTVGSVSQVLAGKAAGLQVNTVSAQPGGTANFRIRGAASPNTGMNDPLILIDGFPVTNTENHESGYYGRGSGNNILATLNPNDIESIEVLKDASSSAIYGSRAGNGVIIITTKRGKQGNATVKYSGSATVQRMANPYEVLDARDFMIQRNKYKREKFLYDNKIAPYGNNSEENVVNPYAPYYTDQQIASPVNNTNWFDEVTRTGFQTQHNVSVNGGTEQTQYMISGNFFKQEGVVKENDLTRFSGRINLDQKLSKYVKMGLNVNYTNNESNEVAVTSGQGETATILNGAAQFSPLLPIKDEDGNFTQNTQATFIANPVSLLDITNKLTKERLLANVYVEVEPIQNLKLKANLGMDRNYQKSKIYLPKTTQKGKDYGGRADIGQSDQKDYLFELTANYNKTFGAHSINGLIGYSFEQRNRESVSLRNDDFLTDGFLYNNIGAGRNPKPGVGSSLSKNEMASFFGRVNYSFKDRYLVTATLRADGSSYFASNHRWGYFPSVSLGWRFIDENFMDFARTVMSNAKLRASYGETGRSAIADYVLSYYSVGKNNVFGGVEDQGVYMSQIGNPDLKWETTTEWNIGLDLGFINNRINVTAEYFTREVKDLINTRNLQSYSEVTSIKWNIGKTQSKGFELTVNTQNIQNKNFSWSTDLTFSFYRDRWKERDPYWKPSAWSEYDEPLRYTHGYLSDGIIQVGEQVDYMPNALPGQVKLKDINGYQRDADGNILYDDKGFALKTGKPDGQLDNADMVRLSNSDPGYLYGINNTFRWKNFDLNIYLYGQLDKYLYTSYKDVWLTGSGNYAGISELNRAYNMPVTVKEVWAHDNQTATRPGYLQGEKGNYGVGDFNKQNAAFLRCRNITLGYTFKVNTVKKIFSNIRVYFDAQNPFTITKYDGVDPETDDTAWAYPNVRSYSLGVDISF